MSRPHNAADLRDLLLDALDETGRAYKVLDKLVTPVSATAVVSVEMNGHAYTIMVRKDD